MNRRQVIFDHYGPVTLQLDNWAHRYNSPARAAADWATFQLTGKVPLFKAHDPQALEDPSDAQLRSGRIRIRSADDLQDVMQLLQEDPDSGWSSIDLFLETLNSFGPLH